jgi:protein gp37
MSNKTSIQWAHSTVNPVMGCDGCELYPSRSRIRESITQTLSAVLSGEVVPQLKELIESETLDSPQAIKLRLKSIAGRLASSVPDHTISRHGLAQEIEHAVCRLFVCYAADLHRFFNANGNRNGYAHPFESPKQFPGRVRTIANLGAPTNDEIENKSWLRGFRRLIFISDMGDALSRNVSFDFLLDEIIKSVSSPEGLRHIWQWVTKRPTRMAEFSRWLKERGIGWPENLVAMTTVTSTDTLGRVDQLREVDARYRGLSLEPLWADIKPNLDGINWVIVGGQSGHHARPFHIEWMGNLRDQCRGEKVAFFAKQFGRRPFSHDLPISLADPHGGEWAEWPEHLRVRELPDAWRL